MRKYIDADELKKVFRDTEDAEYTRWTLAGVIGEIDDIEAADVEEVRHGRWEKVDDNPYEYVAACSVCRNEVKQPTCMLKPIYSYCPICGARMDEEDTNANETL